MPPKKDTNKASPDQPPAWLEQLLVRWDGYFSRFDKLFHFIMKVQETQNAILSKLSALEERPHACSCFDSTGSALYSALVKFIADAKTVDEKSCRIAWVGIDEQSDDSATSAFDKEALKEVIESSADDDLLNEWHSQRIEISRHPKIRNGSHTRWPRIIKIVLRTQALRDKLLAHMKMGRSLTKHYVHSYACKDYTREELDYDRALRKRAGSMNQQEGRLVYVVRDLSIHRLKIPCPLPRTNEVVNALIFCTSTEFYDRLPFLSAHVTSTRTFGNSPTVFCTMHSHVIVPTTAAA